jgi:hypothetical protein
VAISNNRLLAFDGEHVTFAYKDYARGDQRRTMTLTAMEFLRRFVQHILPRGFVRIRSQVSANTCRTARVALPPDLPRQTGVAPPPQLRPARWTRVHNADGDDRRDDPSPPNWPPSLASTAMMTATSETGVHNVAHVWMRVHSATSPDTNRSPPRHPLPPRSRVATSQSRQPRRIAIPAP